MKNPNGPSIEDVDDWNDALRDQLAAQETRKILLHAVDDWEAKNPCTLEPPELEADHDRDWYQEHDPQSLVDSDNEHNRP